MIVLISVWPVFRSFPASGAFVFAASSTSAGMSAVRFGAAFAYGMPFADRGVGVDHARRDARIVGFEGPFSKFSIV